MARGRWLTPDSGAAAGLQACRRFRMSGDLLYLFTGALLELSRSYNYEQFGDMTPDEIADYFENVLNDARDDCMIGELTLYLGANPPAGTLACDGSVYGGGAYPALYAHLAGSVWIMPEGNFRVPDLRGKFPLASNSGAGKNPALQDRVEGAVGGLEAVTLTTDQIPSHNHAEWAPSVPGIALAPGELPVITSTQNILTSSTGGGGSHENMPPFQVAGGWAVRYE